jgi:hypothetical protein
MWYRQRRGMERQMDRLSGVEAVKRTPQTGIPADRTCRVSSHNEGTKGECVVGTARHQFGEGDCRFTERILSLC